MSWCPRKLYWMPTRPAIRDHMLQTSIYEGEMPSQFFVLRCPHHEGWTDAIRAPTKYVSVFSFAVSQEFCTLKIRFLWLLMKWLGPGDLYQCSFPAKNAALLTVCSTTLSATTAFTPEVPLPTRIPQSQVCAVQTRAGMMKRFHPLAPPALQLLSLTPGDFCRLKDSSTPLPDASVKATYEEIDHIKRMVPSISTL